MALSHFAAHHFRADHLLVLGATVGVDAPEQPPVTIAGKPRISRATQYFYKTLSELREEKKQEIARLKRLAKTRVRVAVEAGESDKGYLQHLAETRIEQALPDNANWLGPEQIEELALEVLIFYQAAIARNLADEDDAEAMLLLAD